MNYVRFAKKIGTLPPFLRELGVFLSNVWLGTGTGYARAKSIFKIQMFIVIHFTNLAAQNDAKDCMKKYHPQKSLSNNARPVVLECSPLSRTHNLSVYHLQRANI